MPKVSNKAWSKYKRIVQNFLDQDSGRQEIVWAKHINQILSHGEDSIPQYVFNVIEALCYYNAFRNWPINKSSVSGEQDEENLSIMISRQYLAERGYLDSNGYFDFNWAEDRFIINGIPYRPTGDTNVSQAKDEAIVFLIILKRDRDFLLDPESFPQTYCDIQGELLACSEGQVILGRD